MAELVERAGRVVATATSIPNAIVARQKAAVAVAEYLRLLKELPQTRLAYIGNGSGIVDVSDRPNYKYVRVDSTTGGIAEARNMPLLNPANNDIVRIRRERPGGLGPWQIIDWYGTGVPPLLVCGECSGVPVLQAEFEFDTYNNGSSYALPKSEAVDANYYYATLELIPGGVYRRLYIINISTLGSPSITAALDIPDGSPATRLRDELHMEFSPDGNTLYALATTGGAPPNFSRVIAFDITTRSSPTILRTWDLSSTVNALDFDIVTSGANWYLVLTGVDRASPFDSRVLIYDITGNPVTPTLHGSLATPLNHTWDMSTAGGGYSYALGFESIFGDTDLSIVNITNLASPSFTLHLPSVGTQDESIMELDLEENVLWFADGTNIVGINVASPGSASVLSTTPSGLSYVVDLAVCENFLYAISNQGIVKTWNKSNPASLVVGATVDLSENPTCTILVNDGRVFARSGRMRSSTSPVSHKLFTLTG